MLFRVLGPLEVRRPDGTAAALGGARLRHLLVRLLLEPGRLVTVDALVADLWAEGAPRDPGNALQSLVSRLRRALSDAGVRGGGGLVSFEEYGYRLAVDSDDVDAGRFERLVARGRREAVRQRPEEALRLLTEALGLWRGAALADAAHLPFAIAAATWLEELRTAATEERIAAELSLGRHREVTGELETLAARHPLREQVRVLLMRALAGNGRQADALRVYRETRDLLVSELGTDPSPALEALQLAVLQGDPAVLAPVLAERRAPRRVNLRHQLTSFIDGEDSVARVAATLEGTRLVTLVGPGGIGKTRLAVETATRTAGRLTDGAWLVELAPVRDPSGVEHAVLDSLRTRGAGSAGDLGGPARAAVGPADLLEDQEVLLVLDNCEHLVEAVADVAHDILASCPRVRVLATSRTPLGITGEALHPVAALGLPAEDAAPASLGESPAVRLFAARAAAVVPGFSLKALDGPGAAAVAEVCRRLDGLPLAIELAATKLRTLSPGQLAARLGDRFRLLDRGSRVTLPRHRTLRAVVQWSWDLLDDHEAGFAAALSVFGGPFTLEAAEAVAGGDSADTLSTLASLVEQSVVETVADLPTGADRRYRMLETIRVFAAERLAQARGTARCQERLMRYVLGLVEKSEPQLRGAGQLAAIAGLTSAYDDIRQVLGRAVTAGDAATALRLCAGLGWLWWMQGDSTEALVWLPRALVPPAPPGSGTARDTAAAYLALHTGTDASPPTRHPVGLLLRVRAALAGSGGPEHAGRVLEEALAGDDAWTRALALALRGRMAQAAGDHGRADRDLHAAVDEFSAVGDRWGLATALRSVSRLTTLEGEHGLTVVSLERALTLSRALGARRDVPQLLARLGVERAHAGDLDGARGDLREALALAERSGNRQDRVFALCGLAETDRLSEAPDAAASYRRVLAELERVPEGGGSAGNVRLSVVALSGMGRLAAGAGDLATARERHREALRRALHGGGPALVATALAGWADVVGLDGGPLEAATLLGVAAALRGRSDDGDPDLTRTVERVRGQLGARRYAEAYAAGRALGRVQAESRARRAAGA